MLIKIITCHDVYNVGASLQAFALSKYLQDQGHKVEIIDYKPDYLSGHFSLFGVSNPQYDRPVIRIVYQALKFPKRFAALHGNRKKTFDAFKNEYLPVGNIRYNSIQELSDNPPEADLYIAGSDQIWNTLFKNGNDPAFYLQFVPNDKIRASYAASFATEKLYGTKTEQIKQWLSEMDYISVRETSGIRILNDLGIQNAVCVFDPVFLIQQAEWKNLCFSIAKEKYVLVYDFDKSEKIKEFAIKKAKEKGIKIFTLQKLGYGEKSFSKAGPKEFLSLILNAECIISNSFHATAFSIIFEKEFWVFNRTENINTRIADLLSSLGLESRLVDKTTYSLSRDRIDYTDVNELLQERVRFSKDYLNMITKKGKMND